MRTGNVHDDQVFLLGERQFLQQDLGGFLLRIIVCKRTEVSEADELAGRRAHACEVERFTHPPDAWLFKRRAAPRQLIAMPARHGTVTRVESGSDAFGAEHVDVMWKLVVNPRDQRVGRQGRRQIHVDDLAERVNARVRAAGPIGFELAAPRGGFKRPVQFP